MARRSRLPPGCLGRGGGDRAAVGVRAPGYRRGGDGAAFHHRLSIFGQRIVQVGLKL